LTSKNQDSEIVVIVVDNFRVGGIQRIALDEAYALVALGVKVMLVALEQAKDADDIRQIDGNYFSETKLQILHLPYSNFKKITTIKEILKTTSTKTVISHSVKAIALFRFASLISLRSISIIGYIHQLITLSDRKQAFKRLLFLNLASVVHASSQQFISEISKLRESDKLVRIMFRRKIELDRMGVYLPRLLGIAEYETIELEHTKPALIFLSRLVGWKGFAKYIEIAEALGPKYTYIVFSSRLYLNDESIARQCEKIGAIIVCNKSVAHLNIPGPFIHLYPTYYGQQVKFPQSIGMNVLECAALGIPSIISRDNFSTWPDLEQATLVQTTDWSIRDVTDKITHLFDEGSIIEVNELNHIRKAVSIEGHIYRLRARL
jgi:hypothetical protein